MVEAYQEALRIEDNLLRRKLKVNKYSGYGWGNLREKKVEEVECNSNTMISLLEGDGDVILIEGDVHHQEEEG